MTNESKKVDTQIQNAPSLAATDGAFKVSIVSGSSPRAFALTMSQATVGRHPTNQLVVDDPNVSGVHLEFRRERDGLHLRDLGSRNGTWLDGHRIGHIVAVPPLEIRVGNSRLLIESDAQAVPVERSKKDQFGTLVGESNAMRELFSTVERVAPKDLALLIEGETGTGKEELGRAIHLASPRATHPFVVVDASMLPHALIDSTLFGEETGGEVRAGLIESASGGTVFLDEVSDLPINVQAKLLRVVERGEFVRAGGQLPVRVNVRFLASSSKDLRIEIDAGRFRDDFYYRIASVRVAIPPLRSRREDIALIAKAILASQSAAGTAPRIDDDALEFLAAQRWPGNVRELRNTLLRAAAVTAGIITREDLGFEGASLRSNSERAAIDLREEFAAAKDKAIAQFETTYLAALMRRCEGNVSAASRESGLTRHHLRDLLKKRSLYGTHWVDSE